MWGKKKKKKIALVKTVEPEEDEEETEEDVEEPEDEKEEVKTTKKKDFKILKPNKTSAKIVEGVLLENGIIRYTILSKGSIGEIGEEFELS